MEDVKRQNGGETAVGITCAMKIGHYGAMMDTTSPSIVRFKNQEYTVINGKKGG
jgi:hypothetical protein